MTRPPRTINSCFSAPAAGCREAAWFRDQFCMRVSWDGARGVRLHLSSRRAAPARRSSQRAQGVFALAQGRSVSVGAEGGVVVLTVRRRCERQVPAGCAL
eukprot:CAMPEP_0176310392 /NCGR_PEP_ID=MMETSP0121_2-20121125/65579_1 /TAXON_ID=160619 /ORGANISM="Kryptoperidinium foliaceum, Strain CCMP 1326" /LENGTH=99 /DNA_ID=CAMNT_0017652341 /DNA_START=19 /DNA_END=315 /DNA_ORIENTATION=-